MNLNSDLNFLENLYNKKTALKSRKKIHYQNISFEKDS